MSIEKLIMEFALREKVPVEVDDVVAHLKNDLGVEDDILFFDVDIDTDVLKGEIEHWEHPATDAGPIRRVAHINTAKTLTLPEKRLVQCKEVLHVLDPNHWHTNTFEAAAELMEKIVIPDELQDHANDGIQALSDRIRIWHALAVLFPMAARDLFMTPFREGKISIGFIADMVELPEKYVVLVMNDHWVNVHGRMVRPQRLAGPDRVSSLAADNSPIEVHSVPIGMNAYGYARRMHQQANGKTPISAFRIEVGGVRRTVSLEELVNYPTGNTK